MTQYLVCSSDEPISRSLGYIVEAPGPEEARRAYLRLIHSRDKQFREFVLDRATLLSFTEQFFISTPEEKEHFFETGRIAADRAVVAERIRAFFAEKPECGDAFVAYFERGDLAQMTDEVFEFIAVQDGDGIDVFEVASIPRLLAPEFIQMCEGDPVRRR